VKEKQSWEFYKKGKRKGIKKASFHKEAFLSFQ